MEEEDMASCRWKDRRKVARMEEGCSWVFEGCACGQAALPKDSRLPSTTFRLISALPPIFLPQASLKWRRGKKPASLHWEELIGTLKNFLFPCISPFQHSLNAFDPLRNPCQPNMRYVQPRSPPPPSNKCSDFAQEGFTAAFHFHENSS